LGASACPARAAPGRGDRSARDPPIPNPLRMEPKS